MLARILWLPFGYDLLAHSWRFSRENEKKKKRFMIGGTDTGIPTAGLGRKGVRLGRTLQACHIAA